MLGSVIYFFKVYDIWGGKNYTLVDIPLMIER